MGIMQMFYRVVQVTKVRLELQTTFLFFIGEDNTFIYCALWSVKLCRYFTFTNSYITHYEKYNRGTLILSLNLVYTYFWITSKPYLYMSQICVYKSQFWSLNGFQECRYTGNNTRIFHCVSHYQSSILVVSIFNDSSHRLHCYKWLVESFVQLFH